MRLIREKKKEMGMGETAHFKRENGRKEGRGGEQRQQYESPAEAVIDCSNFTQAVGVECLRVGG